MYLFLNFVLTADFSDFPHLLTREICRPKSFLYAYLSALWAKWVKNV